MWRSSCLHRAGCTQRAFSSSTRRHRSHYDTLSIPRNASRAQIKSAFYKLSKELHPDRRPDDPLAKEKFTKISEAYSILGSDRQRRIYDRSLDQPSQQSHHSQHTYHDPYSAYEPKRPKRTARHAWSSKNTARGRTWSYTYTYTNSGPRTYTAHSGDPFSSPYAQRATGRRPPTSQEQEQTDHDSIVKESGVVRFIQVASILAFVMFLSGGGTART